MWMLVFSPKNTDWLNDLKPIFLLNKTEEAPKSIDFGASYYIFYQSSGRLMKLSLHFCPGYF
jgi:hypothetical protein